MNVHKTCRKRLVYFLKVLCTSNLRRVSSGLCMSQPRTTAGNYMFKINNRNTGPRSGICLKFTIKTTERRRCLYYSLRTYFTLNLLSARDSLVPLASHWSLYCYFWTYFTVHGSSCYQVQNLRWLFCSDDRLCS